MGGETCHGGQSEGIIVMLQEAFASVEDSLYFSMGNTGRPLSLVMVCSTSMKVMSPWDRFEFYRRDRAQMSCPMCTTADWMSEIHCQILPWWCHLLTVDSLYHWWTCGRLLVGSPHWYQACWACWWYHWHKVSMGPIFPQSNPYWAWEIRS